MIVFTVLLKAAIFYKWARYATLKAGNLNVQFFKNSAEKVVWSNDQIF